MCVCVCVCVCVFQRYVCTSESFVYVEGVLVYSRLCSHVCESEKIHETVTEKLKRRGLFVRGKLIINHSFGPLTFLACVSQGLWNCSGEEMNYRVII